MYRIHAIPAGVEMRQIGALREGVREHRPELILLDLMLTGPDGYMRRYQEDLHGTNNNGSRFQQGSRFQAGTSGGNNWVDTACRVE